MTLYNLVIPGTTGHLNTLVSVSAGVVNSKAEPIYSFETLFVIETANFSVGMICVCSSDNCRLIQTLPGRHGVRVVCEKLVLLAFLSFTLVPIIFKKGNGVGCLTHLFL